MANTFVATRAHIVWGICLPLAILVGYMLADAGDSSSLGVLVLVGAVLCVPLVLRWHHPLLILAWNAAIWPSFFPGAMALWMPLSLVTLVFGVLSRATNPTHKFLCPMPLTISVLTLAFVALATMIVTGGLGARVLGSAKHGGKAYFFIFFAIIGFFALASQRIPPKRAMLFAGLFFISGITEAASDMIYMVGPKAYGLFHIFPVANAYYLAVAEASYGTGASLRIGGFGLASVAVVMGMLAMYGLRGLLDIRRPWRGMFLAAAIVIGTYSGFRSMLIMCLLAIAVLFFWEGLYKTRLMFFVVSVTVGLGLFLAVYARELPIQIQRAVSFLPLDVEPAVRQDAQNSVEWRVDMWRNILPEVPQYWFMGKGYLINATDLAMGYESQVRGFGSQWEAAALAGDYHNGPLSLVVPLGGLGAAAFIFFLVMGGRALYQNYRYGPEELRTINRFLLAYFFVRIVHFVLIFGSFYLDLFVFTGMIGLSLSLNGGVQRPVTAPETEPVMAHEEFAWNDY